MKILPFSANLRTELKSASVIGTLSLICLIFCANSLLAAPQRDYWPTQGWRVASPGLHGFDENAVNVALNQLPKICPEVHSLLVVRNGYLVVNHYRPGRDEHNPWNIKSASKSILNSLVGIAIEQGYIKSLDQPVIEFFPEYYDQLDDAEKKKITIKHLLTMSAGLEWVENGAINRQYLKSDNWVKFTWGSKLVAKPGKEWNYSTALTHMLSALLTRAVGTNTATYAKRVLFDPIGASVYEWNKSPEGIDWGGSEVLMTPKDMAKFGYLYLNNGQWENRQVVPAAWVNESVRQTNSANYAFLWWLDTFEGRPMYFAQGLGGQHIVDVPDLDTVVVTTSDIRAQNSALGFIKLVLLPCIQRFEEKDHQLPSAFEIIEHYYKAIGGRNNIAELESIRISGLVEIPAMLDKGAFEIAKGRGHKFLSNIYLDRSPVEKFGSDGVLIWSNHPRGYRILGTEHANSWREEARSWTDLREPVNKLKTVAITQFGGKQCYQLLETKESGITSSDFFETETGLLVGSIRPEKWYSTGLHAFTRVFSEYRTFGTMQFPTKFVVRVQGPERVFTRSNVEFNQVPANSFRLPTRVQLLKMGRLSEAR